VERNKDKKKRNEDDGKRREERVNGNTFPENSPLFSVFLFFSRFSRFYHFLVGFLEDSLLFSRRVPLFGKRKVNEKKERTALRKRRQNFHFSCYFLV